MTGSTISTILIRESGTPDPETHLTPLAANPRMTDPDLATHVEAVRRFNRFYTRRIGALQEGLARSPFSLTEARVVFELARRDRATAAGLAEELGLDPGYLSRILRRFLDQGLVARRPSGTDGRQSLLWLTDAGRAAFAALDEGSCRDVAALLAPLSPTERRRLVDAMEAVRKQLAPRRDDGPPFVLRPPRPGDLGWVVYSHGALYAREYGWDETFEGLVAEIVADFARGHDPRRERCWIAETDGGNVGSVFLVRGSDTVAKLRLLLVDPEARGLGIGRRLVEECVDFARAAGYQGVTLWTNDVLHAARRLYQEAGFRLVRGEPHHSFGHDLMGQTWELRLDGPEARSEPDGVGP